MNDIHETFRRQGLVRPRDGRVLGGVCAGLGRRFGIDPWPARLLFVLLLMVVPGSQLLIYPVLWILMPRRDRLRRRVLTQHPRRPGRLTRPPTPDAGRPREGCRPGQDRHHKIATFGEKVESAPLSHR